MANEQQLRREASKPRALRHHLCFMALGIAITLFTWRALAVVTFYSLRDQSLSHIVLIPFIAAFLIFAARENIFANIGWSLPFGLTAIVTGLGCYAWFSSHGLGEGSWYLSGAVASIVVACTGAFLLAYGVRASRVALFPLVFLLLVIPWPEAILGRVIYLLQQGSTSIAYVLFRAVGVPVLRKGFLLSVPGVTIEVAQECSSIRSSVALFITCLLAAHFSLRKAWHIWVFVALAAVFSVVKNGIRIATLTLLSIYIDPSFLHGSLHRDGGILFFLLALLMLWPVLIHFQRAESAHIQSSAPVEAVAR